MQVTVRTRDDDLLATQAAQHRMALRPGAQAGFGVDMAMLAAIASTGSSISPGSRKMAIAP